MSEIRTVTTTSCRLCEDDSDTCPKRGLDRLIHALSLDQRLDHRTCSVASGPLAGDFLWACFLRDVSISRSNV